MKTIIKAICVCSIAIISSCSGRSNRGTVYNPGDRSKYSSDKERELAIAQKQAGVSGLLSAEQYANAVKLNILVPKVEENFPIAAAQSLTMNMLQITAANGIAGYGGNPAFVFAAIVNPTKEGITNTIPKKNFINYRITFYVANIHSGDVFGTLGQEVMGVGSSREQAIVNAMENVQNNTSLSNLLAESSTKIVEWFENHTASFVAEVKHFLHSGDYTKAYGLLSSVPEEAASCYAFAQQNIDSVHELYLTQMSEIYFRDMQNAIASSDGKYNPEVAACLNMIPANAPIRGIAVTAYESYVADVIEQGNAEKAHQIFMEEETIAIEKLNAEAEVKAQEALMMQMESESAQIGGGADEDFIGSFIGDVSSGIKTMLVDKTESLIFGGVASLLSFI